MMMFSILAFICVIYDLKMVMQNRFIPYAKRKINDKVIKTCSVGYQIVYKEELSVFCAGRT